MAAATSTEVATMKSEKKHKKEKSSKSEKKRAREEDAIAEGDGERKHKKSKSIAGDAIAPSDETNADQEVKKEKRSKKKDKKTKHHDDDDAAAPTANGDDAGEARSEKKKKKKHREQAEAENDADAESALALHDKDEKKEKKKKKKHAEVTDEVVEDVVEKQKKSKKSKHHSADNDDQQADVDAMDVDEPITSKSSKIYQPPDIPSNPQFPFFHQTVSLYEPIFPQGWAQPVTNCQYQHLQHLHNKYVPSLRGVLLDYRNVSLGPEPGREGAATDDETPTTVVSQAEYAVGFGWITADVDLFVPSRGAWMEGSVNLQTEGHIGVVCFGKFNASIEARRLPPSWKWVSNESTEARGFEETASIITADDHGVVRQIHSTGFWVDGDGERVTGKIRFRIRNFDAGTSGETSYLSLEGTMLEKESEKKLVKEEARIAHMRREKKGGRKIERRRAPDFSMTRFVDEEEEEQQPATTATVES